MRFLGQGESALDETSCKLKFTAPVNDYVKLFRISYALEQFDLWLENCDNHVVMHLNI